MNLKMPSLILNHLRILRFKGARRALVRGILTLPSPHRMGRGWREATGEGFPQWIMGVLNALRYQMPAAFRRNWSAFEQSRVTR